VYFFLSLYASGIEFTRDMEITKPTLLLNKTVCLRNIELMANKAVRHHVSFRPHFKTHQSTEIGNWYRQFGVSKITVSSVQMANYFADDGWDDITIAFPFNTHEVSEIETLAQKITLNLVVENSFSLEKIASAVKSPIGIFIEISTGYVRSGISSGNTARIDALLEILKNHSHLNFLGFLTHAGHTYNAKSKYEVQNIHFDAIKKMADLKSRYIEQYPELIISIGDTPSCSVSENFTGIDEIRPGNFVFYDLKQHSLGACSIDDIAARMICPVVSKQRISNEVVIYGGAIHFSKDWMTNIDGKPLYGRVVITRNNQKVLLEPNTYLVRLSQEHGVIRCTPPVYNEIKIGDFLEILPVHSCLTAHAMGRFLLNNGDYIEMMPRF
jgi:D-serine deaminase-like pyridoxal phosphate-dependent protein